MAKKLAKLTRETKKAKLLRLLDEHGGRVSLAEAAKRLYGRSGELEQLQVIRVLNAYRAKDTKFNTIRVRRKHIVQVKTVAAGEE